jgi:hypothetical protein
MSKADIKAASLFNEITNDLKKNYGTTKASKTMIDEIVKKIRSDGIFNSKNYVGCFLAENLLRTFIRHKNIKLSEESQNTALEYKKKEEKNKLNAGIAFDVRKNSQDLSYYLSFHDLVSNIDKSLNVNLSRDINIYKILRDAIAHTAILTKPAKNQLSVCISNINSKIDRILSNKQK